MDVPKESASGSDRSVKISATAGDKSVVAASLSGVGSASGKADASTRSPGITYKEDDAASCGPPVASDAPSVLFRASPKVSVVPNPT